MCLTVMFLCDYGKNKFGSIITTSANFAFDLVKLGVAKIL
jgi:hypothetical protein